MGKEGRVVEGPWAGVVGVPVGEREGVGEGEPVTVDLEIGAVVGGDEEKLAYKVRKLRTGNAMFQCFSLKRTYRGLQVIYVKETVLQVT